jgi:hypothetical protein
VAAQQKEIDSTQQNLENARTELAKNLSSTKDELNGSIAKTHDELVALERKGERSHYEFDLIKSKGFKRVGPLTLSLRKTNTKHDYFDVSMIVEDSTLEKKHVNLYEPVLVYPSSSLRPLEMVANRIDKNGIHGYVSEPKFRETAAVARGAGDVAAPDVPSNTPADSSSPQGSNASNPGAPPDLPHRPQPNM